ncbi:MAG: S-methyl-5-thioribose-1-phosphate isomerase [Gammaproteobacteria bacterium]
MSNFSPVKWNAGMLTLLDQRRLPEEKIYLDFDDMTQVADAISDMVVRGAPAIGITAAYAIVLAARKAYASVGNRWREVIEKDLQYLAEARPTAVNLNWAIAEMRESFAGISGDPEEALLAAAMKIHDDDVAANHEMGRLGAEFIEPNSHVVTHCNAGALATGGYGTALGVIRSAYKNGLIDHVYASETRPWLQGARLTSWELQEDHIPVSLVVDSAVASLMQAGTIQWLIVGSDRIAANGDVANKIGTYSHAVCAKYHGVKVMVVAPASTVDMQVESGKLIPIEHRDPAEITSIKASWIAPRNMAAVNPAFDITPAELVDVIVTEKGIIEQPDKEKMHALFT